jgi:hypothetical protein
MTGLLFNKLGKVLGCDLYSFHHLSRVGELHGLPIDGDARMGEIADRENQPFFGLENPALARPQGNLLERSGI